MKQIKKNSLIYLGYRDSVVYKVNKIDGQMADLEVIYSVLPDHTIGAKSMSINLGDAKFCTDPIIQMFFKAQTMLEQDDKPDLAEWISITKGLGKQLQETYIQFKRKELAFEALEKSVSWLHEV